MKCQRRVLPVPIRAAGFAQTGALGKDIFGTACLTRRIKRNQKKKNLAICTESKLHPKEQPLECSLGMNIDR